MKFKSDVIKDSYLTTIILAQYIPPGPPNIPGGIPPGPPIPPPIPGPPIPGPPIGGIPPIIMGLKAPAIDNNSIYFCYICIPTPGSS